MIFLPVVARELRLASRKQLTYWSRTIAAGVGTLIAAGILLISEVAQGGFGVAIGAILFAIFKFLTFAIVCAAGLFLTSDSISEEKRDGTLGLLFLTDLHGYDVVLGKLGSSSLRAAYGLIAVFPIMGLALLLGGVSGEEFWRLILVLCVTLFFSLTAGIFISAISRDLQKAAGGLLLVLAGVVLGLPAIDAVIAASSGGSFAPAASLLSPSLAFLRVTGGGPHYWLSLGMVFAMSCLSLALACYCTPRAWQEKQGAARILRPKGRTKRNRAALELNPIGWLASRSQWLRIAVPACIIVGILLVAVWLPNYVLQAQGAVCGLFEVFLLLAVASHASRFFCEAKQNGMLELVLVAPLSVNQIVQGYWHAFRNVFLISAILMTAWLVVIGISQFANAGSLNPAGQPFSTVWFQIMISLGGLITFWSGLLCSAWFGIWMGLSTRKPGLAFMKAILFSQALPWLGLIFIQTLFFVLLGFGGVTGFMFFALVPVILTLGTDIVLLLVARRQVLTRMSCYVAQSESTVLPPPINKKTGVIAHPRRT